MYLTYVIYIIINVIVSLLQTSCIIDLNIATFSKLKDYTKLVMTKNNWFGTYKINLIIINSQKVELDNFLRQKIRTNLFQD